MSDFFGGLTGGNIRFTDARINGDGPLPTSLSGPEGIHGDADGRYNFNDSLLSGITPYAYGQGRMGSDRNYQQIPHRKQFSVPPLWLPEPEHNTDSVFQVSHQVDMGDIAFIINAQHKQFMLMPGPHKHVGQGEDHTLPQWNIFCNICTVNYLLAGMYNFVLHYVRSQHNNLDQKHAWYRLFVCFNLERHLKHAKTMYEKEKGSKEHARVLLMLRSKVMLERIVRLNIIPIGICSMSEKQGGQHEVGLKPVQAATNFFTTLTVDGQNRDLVNIWRAIDVDAGDFLILRLEVIDTEEQKYHFVLNHYYKDTVSRSIKMREKSKSIIQLIPRVSKIDKPGNNDLVYNVINSKCLERGWDENACKTLYDFVINPTYSGYWHIGQTYTKKQSFTTVQVPINDMELTKGQLLQINFAPVWKGATPGFNNLQAHVKYCPAFAMQQILFSSLAGMFVDATVSKQSHDSDMPPSGSKRFRRNLVQPQGGSETGGSVQGSSVQGSSVQGSSVQGSSVQGSSEPGSSAQRMSGSSAQLLNTDVAACSDAQAVVVTAATSLPPASGAGAAAVVNAQQSAKGIPPADAWDFEAEMETMFRASSEKTKGTKTKSKTPQ